MVSFVDKRLNKKSYWSNVAESAQMRNADLAYPERDVIVDSLRPTVEICEAVSAGQSAAERLLVLRVAHPLEATDVVDRRHAHAAWKQEGNTLSLYLYSIPWILILLVNKHDNE